ncbi:hypothetical protein DB31_5937 [Hyalangium minutum]|uniref:Uncharacterized protein n=1 Tax=Hyalangium minutum TaxID=394096 RepID=A0A085VYT5_9BACT|nr:hypothetical protein DB31_5937 [Hyalangium minutum]
MNRWRSVFHGGSRARAAESEPGPKRKWYYKTSSTEGRWPRKTPRKLCRSSRIGWTCGPRLRNARGQMMHFVRSCSRIRGRP